MKAAVGRQFSVAPLRPVRPGPASHGVEVPWDGAWGMMDTVGALEKFYGANTEAFLDWLAEIYWRARENVMPPGPAEASRVMACLVPPEREQEGGVAPCVAAWLLELIFTTGDERPEFACALGKVAGPVPGAEELRKVAAEIPQFTAWLHFRGMERAFKRAERREGRKLAMALGKAVKEDDES